MVHSSPCPVANTFYDNLCPFDITTLYLFCYMLKCVLIVVHWNMCFATTYPKLALNIKKYFSIPILKYYTNFNMYAYSISCISYKVTISNQFTFTPIGAIVVVIVWLDLQLPVQSLSITTNMSFNPTRARCTWYNIMWSSLSVTCERSIVFSRYCGFLHQ
jgi:hypothetical protein